LKQYNLTIEKIDAYLAKLTSDQFTIQQQRAHQILKDQQQQHMKMDEGSSPMQLGPGMMNNTLPNPTTNMEPMQ